MKDGRPERRLEDVARDIERRAGGRIDPALEAPRRIVPARGSVASRRLVEAAAATAIVFAVGWGFGHLRATPAWARAGVGSAVPHLVVAAPSPAPLVIVNINVPPAASAHADEPPENEGDSVADLLAEAQARTRLAEANSAPRPAPPPPPGPLIVDGSATRMRNEALQLIAMCKSGRASEVQPLAEDLLKRSPPPWLARRLLDACFGPGR